MCHSCNHHRQSDHKQHKRNIWKIKMIEEIRKDAESRRERAFNRKYGKMNNCIISPKNRIDKYFTLI